MRVHDCAEGEDWSTDVATDDPDEAAEWGAAKAWRDWAWEKSGPSYDFDLWVETESTSRIKYHIGVDFDPTFDARREP